jgi:hypothetical protein
MKIPVEIFTPSQRLVGSVETRYHRVADLLNDPSESFVLLQEVELWQLTGALDHPQALAMVKLQKRAISFVLPQEEEENDPARKQQRFYAFTPKDAYPVLVCLDAFEVRGNVHFPRQGTPVQARDILDLAKTEFVPLTGAILVFLPKPTIAFSADVVIVNRAQVAVVGMLPPPSATQP